MNRPVAFLLLGPASVFVAWLIFVAASTGPWSIAGVSLTILLGMILFSFTFFVAVFAMIADQLVARSLPAILRAFLTAIVGAAISAGLILAVTGGLPLQGILLPFAVGGALCMGISSLLSNDDGPSAPAPRSEIRLS